MRRLLATLGLTLSALACHHGRNHHVAPVPSAVCDGQDGHDRRQDDSVMIKGMMFDSRHDDPCDEDRD